MANAKKSLKVVVLTANMFRDEEVFYPVSHLQKEGWKVDIAAPKIETLHGELGGTVEPDLTIDDVDPEKYDLLLIPGGSPDGAPNTVRQIKKAQEITQSFFAKNKPVAAVCHGPWLLASANVVKGRNLTSFWYDGVPEDIKAAGGIWEDDEVVVDGNLVTSRYPPDLPAFTREMIKLAKT
jgi:protease I